MKRYVYAFDTAQSAKAAVRSLMDIGVPEKCLSIAARPDLQLDKIPDRLLDPSMDFAPAISRGVALGGTAGLFAGLVMMAIPPLGIAIGGASLLGFLAGGALVGAWSGSLVGSSIPDAVRRKFDDEIAAGRLLVVVDAAADHEAAIVSSMGMSTDRHLIWQSA